jgi:hypothetical protein
MRVNPETQANKEDLAHNIEITIRGAFPKRSLRCDQTCRRSRVIAIGTLKQRCVHAYPPGCATISPPVDRDVCGDLGVVALPDAVQV